MKKLNKYLELAIEAAIKAGEKTLKFYQGDFEVLVKDDHSPLTLADLESNQVITSILEPTNINILSEESKIVPHGERKKWKELWLVDPLDGTKEFINKSAEYTVNIALIENEAPVLGVVYAPALETLYYGTVEHGSFKCKVKGDKSVKEILKKSKSMKVEKPESKLRVVASRSHLSAETSEFINKLEKLTGKVDLHAYGSSLKLCMVAEGSADIYPRLGPTMEWDTGASHAVAEFAGCKIINAETAGEIKYNKENLLNPWFIVFNAKLEKTVQEVLGN